MFLVTIGLAIYSGTQLYDHQFHKGKLSFYEVFALACIFVGAIFDIISNIFFTGTST